MARLTEKKPAHSATCSKGCLVAKHGYAQNTEKHMTANKNSIHLHVITERKQHGRIVLSAESDGVCVAVSLHHLCYRVTFSRRPSV